MSFLDELFKPALKCKRVGHRPRLEWRRGYRLPTGLWSSRFVAERVRQEREVCGRCGVEISTWADHGHADPLTGLTTSQDNWDKINAGGCWLDGGRVTS